MTVELIQGLLLAFAVVVILMPAYIRFLRHAGFGKRIRREGPETHLVKEGVPYWLGMGQDIRVSRRVQKTGDVSASDDSSIQHGRNSLVFSSKVAKLMPSDSSVSSTGRRCMGLRASRFLS